MRSNLVLSAVILGTVCLAGCGTANASTDTTSTQHTTKSTTHTTSPTVDSQLTKTGMKIGHLYIGQELSNVQAVYGKPSAKTIVHGNGAPQWEYSKQGFTVGGSPVWTITVTNGFSGSTPRGIHIGSTEIEVKKAYPMYKMVQDNTQVFVESSDKEYSIDFVLKNGKVTQVTLANEKP
ncbi:hypothetical protein [Alicyclobacillus fastidiosus]|uniref:DUF4309 domain-containing protein n=1 Tax=Alicyclobacillus fastidiosus TaxID=392011 RepID=A0ABV5AJ42_9BACL|nr:hypothetical protein [Alicyclobacillus fastidiosus]WEH09188.1 hypothetical protein PYS47_21355 [Alicyclobacillus fastidiosus]